MLGNIICIKIINVLAGFIGIQYINHLKWLNIGFSIFYFLCMRYVTLQIDIHNKSTFLYCTFILPHHFPLRFAFLFLQVVVFFFIFDTFKKSGIDGFLL